MTQVVPLYFFPKFSNKSFRLRSFYATMALAMAFAVSPPRENRLKKLQR
jgi:hypothetical protein